MNDFDLDEFIGSEVDSLRVKHQPTKKPRLETHVARVSHEQNARERIQRNVGPKLAIREEARLWIPND